MIQMGKQEIYDMLKQYKGQAYNVDQIANLTDSTVGAVSESCRRLRKGNEVKFKYANYTTRGKLGGVKPYVYWV